MAHEKRFATNLGELRRRARLSQSEVAIRAKLSISYYCRLEQGRHKPSADTVCAVAAALRIRQKSLKFKPLSGGGK